MSLLQNSLYKNIATQLCKKYPNIFPGYNLNEILFLEENEKTPKNKFYDVKAIKEPYSFTTQQKFIITYYVNNLSTLTNAQKNILIMESLMKVDLDNEKIINFDSKGFYTIFAKFGVDFLENNSVEDPLK